MLIDEIPAYDDLPVHEKIAMAHAWDVFGEGDELGTLNYLTADVVIAAAAEVRTGRSIGLSLPMRAPEPPLFGRKPFEHTLFAIDRNSWDDRIDGYYPQSSSQWDGFRHVRARELGFFGGVTDDPVIGQGTLGIERWAEAGIVGRGVLVDVEGHLADAGEGIPFDEEYAITPSLIHETLDAQGTTVRRGDILLVRSGWPEKFAEHGDGYPERIPGIHAGEDTARMLWNLQIAALATDLPAVEPVPGDPKIGSLHRRVLPLLGIPLGELFDLAPLASACRDRASHSFLFASAPLNLSGGAGSPANAVAIL